MVGPTLGGYLTDQLSWHWLFLINILPGVVILLGVSRFVNVDKGDSSLLAKLDFTGMLSMAAFLGALEYGEAELLLLRANLFGCR